MTHNAKIVVCIAAHADDEALGCAGTLAKHAEKGDEVHLVFMTDGVGARKASETGRVERANAAEKSARIIGAKEVHFHDFPDNAMDSVPFLQIVQSLEKTLEKLLPQIIYTHDHRDLNIDHRLSHQAVLTSCRPQPGSTVEAIYGFEVLSSTGWAGPNEIFTPARFVDISSTFEKKMQALKAYATEMRIHPHARSYDAATTLAQYRGTHVGVSYAEAFTVIREVIR